MDAAMEHAIFGPIEWQAALKWWSGRVQLDFFSVYDVAAAAACAERLGVANWQKSPDNRHQSGDFELRLISDDGSQPSLAQERAFGHFLDNREMICNLVVDAIFDLYRGNWGSWRGTAEPGKEQEYADDLLIPELVSRDGLRRVIRLDALHVLDFPTDDLALIGFCFDCSWDVEHGLGVLVRGGRFVEIGENDITWSAPEFAGQRGSARAATNQQIDEQRGIAAIKKLGGTETLGRTEPDAPAYVQQIDLRRNKQINDADLISLRHFQGLRELELASSQVTDAGLGVLRGLTNLQVLKLAGTRITDTGLRELAELKNLRTLELSGTEITDAGLSALRERKALAVLHLNGTMVTDAGLSELRALKTLQHLELCDTRVTDAGMQELKELQGLLSLDLQGTSVTNAGLKELKAFNSLRYLNLSRTNITDVGLQELTGLKGLRTLKLQSTATSAAGVADLKRALPKLQVLQ
jgi:hypothetical protein